MLAYQSVRLVTALTDFLQCISTFRKTVRTLLFNENFIRTTNTISSGARRNFSWGVRSMAYGGHIYFVSAVYDVTIGRHIHVSKTTFWRSLLTQYSYSSTRTLLISCVIALNINYQRSKLGYRKKIHATLQHSSSKPQNIRLHVKTGE